MNIHKRPSKALLLLASLAVATACLTRLVAAKPAGHYVAHEWGTFTSVQGGDGVLLDWHPLQSSVLPRFVYDWQHRGLDRRTTANLLVGKAALMALQRMETPVIYFYSDRQQTVDVSVNFPQGAITEWYPQACQIGPSSVPVPPAIAKLDEYAHKAGAAPGFSFAALLGQREIKESRLRWGGVEILPADKHSWLTGSLPADRSGSHYFAARETDSDYLRMYSTAATNPAPEVEKFLFYRGVGNFPTPLRVTMDTKDSVTLANTGPDPLTHLFVLGLANRSGTFLELDRLEPGAQRTVRLEDADRSGPIDKVADQLGQQMAEALEKEGLFQREASAMVHTWRDSWFEEDGVRVLYVLPRAWTDHTLPLALDPAPRQLVRVMVGRAEMLSPTLEQSLTSALLKAKEGDELQREFVMAQLRKLGRFAQPALGLATQGFDPETSQMAWDLFRTATENPKPAIAVANPGNR
jgi:hypothetical protein